MPRYILLSTLTTEGRKTLKEKPYRIREVDEEIEKMGIKILKQYARFCNCQITILLSQADVKI